MRIAASKPGSETYQLIEVAANVVAKQYEHMTFELVPTLGSSQNLRLLKANQVQTSSRTSDSEMINEARLMAKLFPDLFQLVVRDDSDIHTISDYYAEKA